MDILENVVLDAIANDIALEVKKGKWPGFTENHQDPYSCLSILTEFQNRAIGYNLNEYVRSLANAIEKQGYK